MTSSPGINSDSGLEMQTKPLFSKGSRKPNASDLVVRHPLLPPPGSRIPTTGSLGLYPAPARDEAPPDTSIFPADSGLRSVAADAFHPPRPLAFPFRLRLRLAAAAGGRSTRAAARHKPRTRGTRRRLLRETATAPKATFFSAPDPSAPALSCGLRSITCEKG